MSTHKRSAGLLISSLWLLGCGEGETTDAEPSPTLKIAGPTFWQDVAPILNDKCTACHQTGGIAPFALDNYEDAEQRAQQIADLTASRIMPPYLMQVGDDCGSFDESATLSSAEIDVIGAWARGDRARGEFAPLSPEVLGSLAEGTDYQTPDFTPQIQGGVLAEFDEYRCFQIDLGLAADRFVTGFQVTPGNARIVHHVLTMLVDPTAEAAIDGLSNAQAIQQLHEQSPEREGWPCFSGAGAGVRVDSAPAAWAPGSEPFEFPAGVGVRVRPEHVLVVQVHYNLANPELRGEADQTGVRLRFADSVERQAGLILNDAFLDTLANEVPDMLEPGKQAVPYSWTLTGAQLGLIPGISLELLSMSPHMHQRGRKYTFELGRGDAFECMGQVNRWDFNWQRVYDYTQPPQIDADTQIRVSCEYDTSGDSLPILPGWGTRNEMCEATLIVAFPPGIRF